MTDSTGSNMSTSSTDKERLNRLEITMGQAVSSLETVVKTVGTVVDKTDQLTGHVAKLDASLEAVVNTMGHHDQLPTRVSRLEAERGKIPIGTITGATGMALGLGALVLNLTLSPIQTQLSELETSRKTTIEQHIPDLASSLANLRARVGENETELDRIWSDPNVGVFATAMWRGKASQQLEYIDKDLDEIRLRLHSHQPGVSGDAE